MTCGIQYADVEHPLRLQVVDDTRQRGDPGDAEDGRAEELTRLRPGSLVRADSVCAAPAGTGTIARIWSAGLKLKPKLMMHRWVEMGGCCVLSLLLRVCQRSCACFGGDVYSVVC